MVESFHLHFSLTSNNLARKFDVYTSHTSPTLSYLSLTMNNLLHCTIFTVFCILFFIPSSHCDDELFEKCNGFYNFSCGSDIVLNISYPFWGKDRPPRCGRAEFELTCEEDHFHPVLKSSPEKLRVLRINTTDQTVRILRKDLPWNFSSCFDRANVSVDFNQFLYSYSSNVRNLSLFYNCSDVTQLVIHNYICHQQGREDRKGFYTIDDKPDIFPNNTGAVTCREVTKVPILLDITALHESRPSENLQWLRYILDLGLEVKYDAKNELCSACRLSGGICGSNETNHGAFLCLCRDKPQPLICPAKGNSLDLGRKLGIGFGAAIGGMGLMAFLCYFYIRRYKKKHAPSSYTTRSVYSDPSTMVDLEKRDNFRGVQLFTYDELQEATDNFDSARELGDGGFGTVYYGKLQDGRSVAVKRLYESNYKRVEQFMNEVEILARLRHQNLVSLYGCTSRHSRELLLVYDYVPNGTVADHLHGPSAKPGALPWPTRLKIAIETASALTYLHASDIIHRDVKTNNILLDNNFRVRVADFGLSRLFPTNVTHVSTAPQGTPGYVDPEYHQCYQLTVKSDVFSFGVVLIELISSMPAVDITRHRHEINLSNMAINKIQNKALHELVDPTLGFDSDCKVRKMITAVAELAFQCLQAEKDMRPSMADVLEILKGIQRDGYDKEKAEDMEIPSDDFGLLQKSPIPVSPDSVTFKWISTKTTPNTSNS
ncbi:LEAF RUST 10 DISEASE-RESISTANCE LOCUS RECEPTOR-LIKE PROTEIN KINASE-like 1.2 isoform X1 [Mangifera indica]|uniref:LEAF RUST 10 DISEASE-RESISTANCE LOCUS RECEPTOR-LIKE PROTEIN KINASE-like 1.2 isoform X1 n=1 Tax=Mangifera indica TaxID=29780 RepID=UPI001CF9CC22|nr:LEAF RUST 10 DISEASE-RESISTANCE LOCUS RECEPTOR-LIKE PROTEIN KINASE-like 1.2 isoform X1 [Mangifera indica]